MDNTTGGNIRSIIDRFNPAQRQAATSTQGPMLVIAGAGSGKTSVLTARIAVLMSEDVAPERILALTFTKKAAEEMRNRIILMQGDAARRLCMGTFHSVFIRFLRPFAGRIGFGNNFTILDEDDSLSVLKRCIEEVVNSHRAPKENWTEEMKRSYKEEDAHYKPKTISGIISSYKNELITVQEYFNNKELVEYNKNMQRPLIGEIYKKYVETCHRTNVMDFDDILLYTDIMLNNCPDVKAMLAGSFDYILVDEYQDTNVAQYSILRRLTWLNKNICVVGDDSQSIYAFRGARIQNILNFHKDYPGAEVIKLEQNYRSTKNIVNAANNLISYNEGRIPKICFADAETGDDIRLKVTQDEKDEASFIAKEIISAHKNKGLRYADIAVLYRTNAQSRAIEDAMVKSHIPYTVYSGVAFFSRMEVKDLMAYWKLAVNPDDDESFRRVVNKPVRGFGKAAMENLQNVASQWGCSLYRAASHPQIALCGFAPKAAAGLQNFVDNINECIGAAVSMPAYKAAAYISDQAGFYQEYVYANDEESLQRADNLRELVDSVKSYEEDLEAANRELDLEKKEKPTLEGYLQNIMLLSNADTGGTGEDKVSLMTVHCAKGLEYETVFVAGMEAYLFPLEIDRTDFEREEERRLFYVAVTRAKKHLILTRAQQRLRFGKRENTQESSFVRELIKKNPNAVEEEDSDSSNDKDTL